LEDVSEGIVSFKPSEKSLRSILSSVPNSSTGRDSLSRRRSSASEALVKLRLMNSVPSLLKSPPGQKSPTRLIKNFLIDKISLILRTPRSPTERFVTKFPQNANDENSVSRHSVEPVELLEDLPNASQIGMVLLLRFINFFEVLFFLGS
jgi:hypothetical protein